jgi:hypothetical protein
MFSKEMENVQNIDENCWKSVQKQLKILWKSGKCGILISEKLQNVMVKR